MAEYPLLNHVEMVYRPGDREAARAFFETMGFEVSEMPGGPWLIITIDPRAVVGPDNVMYANEPTPAQRNFEAALDHALANDKRLADTLERYRAIRREHPQYVFHFGANLPTQEDWAQRVERLEEARRSHPLLQGRVDVGITKGGTTGARARMAQAFVSTDILSCGPFPFAGLLFDLQWIPDLDLANMPPVDYPDMATMV